MTNLSSVLSYTIKKLWHGLAILLVTLAVLLSLFRYALPHANNHKQFVEDWVADEFGIDLQIGRISATWRGAGPSIILSDVTLTQIEQSPVYFSVDNVWIDIHFWQSIKQRIVISERLDIDGAHLEIYPEQFSAKNKGNFPIVKALKNVFLIQLERFNITNGAFTVITDSRQERYEVDSVTWINEGEHHQGMGNIRVNQLTNNSASFIVDLQGTVDTLSGTFFAKADDLDVSPWLNEWLTTHYPLQQSKANISAWLSVNDNAFDQMHIALGGSSLLWDRGSEESLLTEFNSGTIQARPTDKGWAFRVDQLVMSQAGSTFVTDLVGETDYQGNTLINTVKPVSLAPMSSVLALITGDEFSQKLTQLKVDGELATLQVHWKEQQPSVRAKLLDVSWQNFDKTPGLSSVDLELVWHNAQGHIQASSSSASIDMSTINGKVLENVDISSDVYLYFEQEDVVPGWSISIPSFSMSSDDLSFNVQLHHQLATQFTQLSLELDKLLLKQVPELLPKSLMHENTVAFLNRALAGKGTINSAHLVFSGDPTEFPFADNQGIFQAKLKVDDADFAFSPKWPALTHLDMTLLFENQSLYLNSPYGYLDAVQLESLEGEIPVLKASSEISLTALGHATGQSVAALLEKSTLTKLSKILNERVLIDGDLYANLDLEVPLKKGKKPKASGAVALQGAKVTIPNLKLELLDATGTLSFFDSQIAANQLNGLLYGQNVAVALKGATKNKDYQLDIDLDATWDTKQTFAQFKLPLRDSVSGQFQWQGEVTSLFTPTDTQFEVLIKSDLQGMAADLPMPLFKQASDSSLLQITAIGDKQQSDVTLLYGDEVTFKGVLEHKPLSFSQSLLTLGQPGNFVPSEDYAILATIPEVTFAQWNQLKRDIDQHYEIVPRREVPLLPSPQRVYLESEKLLVGSQEFEKARLNAVQDTGIWRIELSSKQALATGVVPATWQQDGINVFAEKLHLSSQARDNQAAESVPQQLNIDYPLRFRCDDCRVNDILIGKIDLELNPEEGGVYIDRLNINHPEASLMANGQWQYDKSADTQLKGQFKSRDVGRWLDSLGLSSGIKDSEADMEFDVNWLGSPMNFQLANLSGNMQLALSDGYLSQVSDKGSRIFTLFSFDSLIRKLSLDFRDVFAQGFFYDDIKGSFVLDNGKVSTSDTVVDGGAGEIEITGFTQLDKEELNYNISFTPNVTGNLPFLVYFLANPPTALAALALDQMLTSAKVISNINYKVTGSFSEPVFTEVGRDSKDITLPAKQPVEQQEIDKPPLTEEDLTKVKVKVVDS